MPKEKPQQLQRYVVLRNPEKGYLRNGNVSIIKQATEGEGEEDWIVWAPEVPTPAAKEIVEALNANLERDREWRASLKGNFV